MSDQTSSQRRLPTGSRYLQSVGDLMAGLLALFMLVAMVFALNLQQATEQADKQRDSYEARVERLEEARQARDRLLERLRDTLLQDHHVKVEIDVDQGVLRLGENAVTFPSGAHECHSGAPTCALDKVAQALRTVLPCYVAESPERNSCGDLAPAALVDSVLIEGHTDAVPPMGTLVSGCRDNLCLSTFRANWTFAELRRQWPGSEALRNSGGRSVFGVSGYGADRPVFDGACTYSSGGGDPCAQNRRIDLRFIMEPPQVAEGEEIVLRPAQEIRMVLEGSE